MIPEDRIFYPTIDELELDLGLRTISLVEQPAIAYGFLKFSEEEPDKFQLTLSQDDQPEVFKLTLSEDDQMIVTGPVLIPELPIHRFDTKGMGGEFWIVFTAQRIKEVVKKFGKDNLFNKINKEHTPDMINGTLLETWFSKSENELGYDVPIGTWFASYQIEDREYWNEYIKTGKIKGFSIEGKFKFVPKSKALEVKQSAIDVDELMFNEVKEVILKMDEEMILNYFSRNDVGTSKYDLDLSEVQYSDINENDIYNIQLDAPDVFYYYDAKPDATFNGSGKLTDEKTRNFCKNIVSQGKYFSAKEIVSLSSELGYSVFSYAGGNYCRHRWTKATGFKFLPRK
ncbi:MAG TPA: XkdF-like putative serine protease domain-containing protein [Bacteroidia bacterium]|jgi:hypothetical protein